MPIPKVFHRLHLGRGPVHRQTLEWDRKLLELNPDWELRYWREADLPPFRNRAIYDLSKNTGHRADIARYELLYQVGGVYLDWDMDPRQPMPSLEGISAFAGSVRPFPYGGVTIETEIAILGCEPGHPFFAYLLENLTPWAMLNLGHDPARRTGPHFFHTMLEEWQQLQGAAPSERSESKGGLKRFEPPVFYPVIPDERAQAWKPHHGSIFVHHFWATWIGPGNGGLQFIPEPKARQALRQLLACSTPATSSTATPTPTVSRASQAA